MALDLGKMYGPLPLGAWVGVVGAGVGVVVWQRQNSGGSGAPVAVDDTSGTPGVGDGSVGGWNPTQPPAAGETPVEPTVTDNESWAVKATTWLIAHGYDPTVATSAMSKAINSEKLSASEWAMWRIVLGAIGPPPQVLVPGPSLASPVPGPPKPKPPPTPPKPPAPKPTARWYTVRRGDTLWALGAHYYHNGLLWTRIYNANRYGVRRPDGSKGMIKNPNHIEVGWRLLIP